LPAVAAQTRLFGILDELADDPGAHIAREHGSFLRNDLLGIVEFGRLREMRDVAGVDHEGWLRRHCLDLADGLFERAIDVRVRGLVEPHVAVADLQEGERAYALRHRLVHKPKGARYAARDCPED